MMTHIQDTGYNNGSIFKQLVHMQCVVIVKAILMLTLMLGKERRGQSPLEGNNALEIEMNFK